MTDEERDELYGADANEWLRRWDAGQPVWSVSMGGLGPGYEQCIQMMAAEMLRALLVAQPDKTNGEACGAIIEEAANVKDIVSRLGVTWAQYGAACNLAANIYRRWPDCILDKEIDDRRIQVSKAFPVA